VNHLRRTLNRLAAAGLSLTASSTMAQTVPTPEPSRGKLLYETHCIACHTTQMHWRDKRLVQDFAGLRAQVRGWQTRARLGWSGDDILEVARHLNRTIYRLPEGKERRGAAPAWRVAEAPARRVAEAPR
jgi:mono/diheme cytochrome c family protein